MNILEAGKKIQCLEAEVRRLERALTSAKLLTALIEVPTEIHHVPVDLTARDQDVLVRLIEGDSNEEIGAHLFMALGTVKTHVLRLSKTFGTHNRTSTVRAAVQAGFVSPNQEQQEPYFARIGASS